MGFPRTPHLFDLGAATRDDLRMKDGEKLLSSKDQMTLEEKVDGANLGLKWDPSAKGFVGYNRSKTIFASGVVEGDSQFRQLGEWINSHETSLRSILGEDGNYIIYGEWLAHKHSIHYTGLPDYFLAFDIFDLGAEKFLSRERFKEAIEKGNASSEGPPLFCVPEIKVDKQHLSKDEIVSICLGAKSSFYDGPVEGVYLKWDQGPWLQQRAKLVSPDFQQQLETSEHWSKQIREKNRIDYSKQYQ